MCIYLYIHIYIYIYIYIYIIYIYIFLYIYAIMKKMCPTGYHNNGFVTVQALEHMMYGYTLLVPMSQRVLNKPSKKRNVSGHKWSTTHRVLKHRKISVVYIQSWKQYALPVIITMALWQLMHLGTWWTVTNCWYQWTKKYSTSQARGVI